MKREERGAKREKRGPHKKNPPTLKIREKRGRTHKKTPKGGASSEARLNVAQASLSEGGNSKKSPRKKEETLAQASQPARERKGAQQANRPERGPRPSEECLKTKGGEQHVRKVQEAGGGDSTDP